MEILKRILNAGFIEGSVSAKPGDPIISIKPGDDKSKCVIEVRNQEEVINAIRLNGVCLLSSKLKISKNSAKSLTGPATLQNDPTQQVEFASLSNLEKVSYLVI